MVTEHNATPTNQSTTQVAYDALASYSLCDKNSYLLFSYVLSLWGWGWLSLTV